MLPHGKGVKEGFGGWGLAKGGILWSPSGESLIGPGSVDECGGVGFLRARIAANNALVWSVFGV
jgi:hypothetical protein